MSRPCANTRMERAAEQAAYRTDKARSEEKRIEHLRRLRTRADKLIACECDSEDDAVQILRFAMIGAAHRLGLFGLGHEAKMLAAALSKGQKPPAIRARANGEHAFARLTKADNDREAG